MTTTAPNAPAPGTALPCPLCQAEMVGVPEGFHHPEVDGSDCPIASNYWSSAYYLAAWNTRTPDPALAAENARLIAENASLLELGNALSASADDINGEIDAQTYDEKRRLRDWEDDHRWEIVVNAGEERALNKALCAWQSYVRALIKE